MSLHGYRRRHNRGQSFVETLIILPLFFLFVFLILQLGHLGIAVALVNYGASSAAHLAVEQNDTTHSLADTQFKSLLAVGLKNPKISTTSDGDPISPNVTVTACAELIAYPFVGPFLSKTLKPSTSGDACLTGTKSFGPIGLKGPPYKFVIQGQAVARMNYNAAK